MKFGETLQRQSIPAFSRHNIDYDDIKLFIKDRTTPGKGKAVSIPGRADERLLDFENDLFNILKEQHDRINAFVKCKVGEVQRRQDDCNKLLRKLSSRTNPTNDRRITISQLQRYGRLENDVVRAADELKSLSRFNATQRTAFRKLLKKYRKWTGSQDLEDRFRDEILDDPKSFTKLDLGPLLDEYSSTRQRIKHLYEQTVQQASGDSPKASQVSVESSTVQTLRAAIDTASPIHFDVSFATTPLGRSGTLASYFVHPDNVVELQMLLLQYANYFSPRSRSNSLVTPISSSPQTKVSKDSASDMADYHLLAADCIDRYAQEQSALTVDEREHSPGSTLQRSKAIVCWNHLDEAMAALRCRSGRMKAATFKSKRAPTFFDRSVDISSKKDIAGDATMLEIRQELEKDERIQPLFAMSCCRSRLVGQKDDSDTALMMTLDTGISVQHPSDSKRTSTGSKFPFAVLVVRQEGSPSNEFINMLDQSYLVERVRGFSMEHHAVWQALHPTNMSQPFWLPILDRDIRKLPPPALVKRNSRSGQSAATTAPSTASLDSGANITDSTTAVETANEGSQIDSFSPQLTPTQRKKKLRVYAQPQTPPVHYWNEYDDPEDGPSDTYVLYVDPHERSVFDRFIDRAGKVFGYRPADQYGQDDTLTSPATDDETSSDEGTGLKTSRRYKSYGAIRDVVSSTLGNDGGAATIITTTDLERRVGPLPQVSAMCFVASIIILGVAYIMAFTGRHRYIHEVQAGVIVAIVSCLAFAITGFMGAFRRDSTGMTGKLIGTFILLLDGVCSGGLVAWCFFS